MHYADADPLGGLGIESPDPAFEAVRFAERTIGLGLWHWHAATGAMDWSDGVYDLLGIERRSLKPSFGRLLATMHPEDRMRHADLAVAVARGETVARRFRVIAPDGRLRMLALRGEGRFDACGDPVGALGLLQDATEQRIAHAPPGPQELQPITGAQVRAARAVVNWSVRELATASGVSISTIRRMEEFDGPVGASTPHPARVKAALEKAGAEFFSCHGAKPAVRPR